MPKKKKTSEFELNPLVQQGDKIILLKANNGQLLHEGKVLTVINPCYNRRGSFSARGENNQSISIYYTGPGDEFCLATRKAKASATKLKIEKMKKELKQLEEQYKVLSEYETEEEYVAAKICKILQNKEDTKAVAQILKEFQRTDLV